MAASASDVLAAHIVVKDGTEREAKILQQGNGEVFVRYTGPDQGLSEWVSTEHVRPAKRRRTSTRVASIVGADDGRSSNSPAPKTINGPIVRPRRVGPRRQPSPSSDSDIEIVSIGPKPGESYAPPTSGGSGVVKSDVAQELSSNEIPTAQLPEPTTAQLPQPNGNNEQTPPAGAGEQNSETKMTEEEFDIAHHKQITSRRNFDKVNFGQWQIKTWYFSPYPLSEAEPEPAPPVADTRIPGVARTTARSHGRTSDLLAGGLGRDYAEKSILWVCDRCFKYMAEGIVWEAHVRKCARKNPPGKKVYQRGAHTIWEVDGAKEKLYCQNLSLFGKLFIDVKTLFFDCDNFLFYLLTDADSQRDHVLGFFSKEKVSYDDYNLACIIVLPPYQRKGYGMLMIEFSYELSRRAGRVGTPERPLSDLGLRSYLTYWISTILRYLKHMLSVMPPELSSVTTLNSIPDFNRLRTSSSDVESFTSVARKRRKTKGWDGEAHALFAPPPPPVDASHTLQRTLETHPNPDGSATTHAVIRCSMAEIARATNLRVEDAAFALSECGLLSIRDGEATVVITRLAVEKAASERRLKRMCMEVQHVLLP